MESNYKQELLGKNLNYLNEDENELYKNNINLIDSCQCVLKHGHFDKLDRETIEQIHRLSENAEKLLRFLQSIDQEREKTFLDE